MKEYRKPTMQLIVFNAEDVLGVSTSNFFIGWLGVLDDGGDFDE